MPFLTKLYKNDYERHFMNCSEISLKNYDKNLKFYSAAVAMTFKMN